MFENVVQLVYVINVMKKMIKMDIQFNNFLVSHPDDPRIIPRLLLVL